MLSLHKSATNLTGTFLPIRAFAASVGFVPLYGSAVGSVSFRTILYAFPFTSSVVLSTL